MIFIHICTNRRLLSNTYTQYHTYTYSSVLFILLFFVFFTFFYVPSTSFPFDLFSLSILFFTKNIIVIIAFNISTFIAFFFIFLSLLLFISVLFFPSSLPSLCLILHFVPSHFILFILTFHSFFRCLFFSYF